MELNFIWKENTAQYATGELLFLNRIHIGGYEWNSSRSRDDKTPDIDYGGNINLPSLKNSRVYAGTPETIRLKMQNIIIAWFNEATKQKENKDG